MNIKAIQTFLLEQYLKKPSIDKILLTFGVVGWLASMVAQDVAIAGNKQISPEKKKFLIPQETADGLCNATMLVLFTTTLKSMVMKMFDKGNLMSKEASEAFKAVCEKTNKTKKEMGDILTNTAGKKEQKALFKILKKQETVDKGIDSILTEIEDSVYKNKEMSGMSDDVAKLVDKIATQTKRSVEDVTKNLAAYKIKDDMLKQLNSHKCYASYKTGLGVVVAMIGGIFSANIFAPIFRNNIAVHFKNKADLEAAKKDPFKAMATSTKLVKPAKTYSTFTPYSNITKI